MTTRPIATARSGAPRIQRLGERLRQLRIGAGLTQGQLAGDRFSKEYISQIERGKTRPTTETIEWLALRLGVDQSFLESGVSADERARAETILARADALLDEHRFDDALAEYAKSLPAVLGTGAAELHVRALNGEGIALAQTGDVKSGLARLAEARTLVEGPEFSDVDRAEVLYRSLPLSAAEHRHGGRDLRRGTRIGRTFGSAVRPAPARDLRLAFALLPPAARLRGGTRGRRAGARARRRDAGRPGARAGVLPGIGAGGA
jgi:transcriptional regulator with XRE-family HTH domain